MDVLTMVSSAKSPTQRRSQWGLLLGLALVSCGGPPNGSTSTTTGSTTSSTVTAGVQIMALSDRKPDSPARLVRWIDVTTSAPASLSMTWTDGDHVGEYTSPLVAADQSLPLVGMRADRSYELTVTATPEGGGTATTASITLTNAALPADFPTIDILSHESTAMEPGITLIDIDENDTGAHYLVAFDTDLEVVWYAQMAWEDVRLTDWGTLMGNRRRGAYEMDFMGTELNYWSGQGDPAAVQIGPAFLHHDVIPMGGDGFLSLSNGIWPMLDYPASYTNPNATQAGQVKSPVIVRVNAAGETLYALDIGDYADRYRLGYDSLSTEGGLLDWAHGNALVLTSDGGFVVSLRHQEALLKIDANFDLEWILGDPGGWSAEYQPYLFEPIGDNFAWFYHQHAPELSETGELVMFDNHNVDNTPYTGPPADGTGRRSRVVRYQLDEVARTVEMTGNWDNFGPNTPLYSAALGDADVLSETGNILMVSGFNTQENGQNSAELGFGTKTVHLIEFHPDASTTPAMHMRFSSPISLGTAGWQSYRAEHIDALVPPPAIEN